MQKVVISFVSLCLLALIACGQNQSTKSMNSKESKAIKEVITQFAAAGDQQNVEKLSPHLHDSYRIAFNRAFGSDDLQIIDRKTYLDMVGAKKLGGDKRKIEFVQIDVQEHIASVKAVLRGKQAILTSYFTLAKAASGEWKLVSDMPVMEVLEN